MKAVSELTRRGFIKSAALATAAAGIPGIMGVALQTTAGKPNPRDRDPVRRYKQEAHRWGMHIPSLAGVWDRGVQIHSPCCPNEDPPAQRGPLKDSPSKNCEDILVFRPPPRPDHEDEEENQLTPWLAVHFAKRK